MSYSQHLIERLADWVARNWTNFQLAITFQKYGCNNWEFRGFSKRQRAMSVLSEIMAGADGQRIIGDLLQKVGERIQWKKVNGRSNRIDKQVITALRADGYEIMNGMVVPAPALSSTFDSMSPLGIELDRLGWNVARGHLIQAVDNFQRGNWAACNAQLRALLEEIFNCIAKAKYSGEAKPPLGGGARKFLETAGIVSKKESEFIQSWFNILHTSGPHPGLSTEEDARWRFFVTITTAFWALKAIR